LWAKKAKKGRWQVKKLTTPRAEQYRGIAGNAGRKGQRGAGLKGEKKKKMDNGLGGKHREGKGSTLV